MGKFSSPGNILRILIFYLNGRKCDCCRVHECSPRIRNYIEKFKENVDFRLQSLIVAR